MIRDLCICEGSSAWHTYYDTGPRYLRGSSAWHSKCGTRFTNSSERIFYLFERIFYSNDLLIRPNESFTCPNESFICSNDSFICSNDLLIRPNDSFICSNDKLIRWHFIWHFILWHFIVSIYLSYFTFIFPRTEPNSIFFRPKQLFHFLSNLVKGDFNPLYCVTKSSLVHKLCYKFNKVYMFKDHVRTHKVVDVAIKTDICNHIETV